MAPQFASIFRFLRFDCLRKNNFLSRLLLAGAIPLLALGLQWLLWRYISPFVWFFFYPAVFLSAWVGGFWSGMISTALSAGIVYFFFLPPQLSWKLDNPVNIFSIVVFAIMGYLFSDVQQRLQAARRRAEAALVETQAANEKISALYEKTLELDELKAQFFANVSHELRTPLTLILNPLKNALQDAGLSPQTRHDLEVVERNARFLHRHVNELLNLSRLDARQMSLQYAHFDLAALARALASQFEIAAAERAIRFELQVPGSLAAQLDAVKCQHILLNLLSNAFKFTPDGGSICLSLRSEAGDALIEVGDSGPGIPPAKREAVFERFLQLEGGATRRQGGTGLGLSIVKEYVTLQRGAVQVGESPAGGALFSVRLPLSAPQDALLAPAPQEFDREPGLELVAELAQAHRQPADGGNLLPTGAALILVVEDNPDMSEFICAALSRDYRVVSAPNGRQGLEKAQALRPDLILSDLMMPGMSGEQMALALRAQPGLAEIPLVILTAKADDATRLALLRAGVQDYLQKPFSEEELRVRIAKILAARKLESEALQASEMRYRSLFENMTEGFAYCRMIFEAGEPVDWVYLSVNKAFEDLTGLRNASGKKVSELIPGIRQSDPLLFPTYARVATTGNPEKFEMYVNSLAMWFSVSVYSPERGYFIATFDVITERKQAEVALRESEASLKASQRVAHVGHWTWDLVSNQVSWSDEMFRIFGLDPQEFDGDLDKVIARAIHPDDRAKVEASNAAALQEQAPAPLEYRVVWPDGTLHTVFAIPAERDLDKRGHILRLSGIVKDISEQRLSEERIRKSLAEKETLLRELYHRTKNNMAVIIALLDLQARSFSDEHLREEFVEAENRIRSMALVHQKLYEAQDLSHINLKEYLGELVTLMLQSYCVTPARIALRYEMDDVSVLFDSAIPCGLIANELISNALKYAFPAGTEGEIRVGLRALAGGEIELSIADNGKGFPPGFDLRRDGQLGLQNIFILAERQLQGQVVFSSAQGVACTIRFRDQNYEARV